MVAETKGLCRQGEFGRGSDGASKDCFKCLSGPHVAHMREEPIFAEGRRNKTLKFITTNKVVTLKAKCIFAMVSRQLDPKDSERR